MTTHTPGPWKVYSQYGEIGNITNSDGSIVVAQAQQIEPRSHKVRLANTYLIASAPELLAEIEREYIELADYTNDWPGRNSMKGQIKLGRLRDLIARATRKSEQEIQDDYGTRAARAKEEKT